MTKSNPWVPWRLVLLTRLRVLAGRISRATRHLRSQLPRLVWPGASQLPPHAYLKGPLIVMMCTEEYGCQRFRYPSLDDAIAGMAMLARYAYNQYLIDGAEREFRVIPEGAMSQTHGPAIHR